MSGRPMSDEFDGLDATEKAGIGATLNRCRALAAKIGNELRNKRPEHFIDKLSLADVHASLERAADVLSAVKGSRAGPSAASIIEGDLRLPTLSRAWCGLLESRSGKLKIQLKLCRP